MARLALKLLVAVLIVVLSAGFLVGLFETSGLEAGLLGVGLLISFLLLIFGIIPRWLVFLAWSILAFYVFFLVNPPPSGDLGDLLRDPRVLLPLALFALFVALLAKWVSDIRAVRRWERQVNEETRERVKDVQTRLAEGEKGVLQGPQTETGLPVTDIGTLERMKDLFAVEELVAAGEERDATISRLHEVVVRMADDSRRSGRRSTAMGIVTFVLGALIGYAPTIYEAVKAMLPF